MSFPFSELFNFPSPPGDLTSLEHVAGAPFSTGFYHLNRIRGLVETDAVGFAWVITLSPIGIGQTVGQTVTTFEDYIAQVLEVKSDIGGTTYNGAVYNIAQDEGRQMFTEYPITRLALWVGPATTIDMYWILFL